MKPPQFIKEHLRLIKLLKSGTKRQQILEAIAQSRELKEYLRNKKKK